MNTFKFIDGKFVITEGYGSVKKNESGGRPRADRGPDRKNRAAKRAAAAQATTSVEEPKPAAAPVEQPPVADTKAPEAPATQTAQSAAKLVVSPDAKKVSSKLVSVGIPKLDADKIAAGFVEYAKQRVVRESKFFRKAKLGLIIESIVKKRLKKLKEGEGSAEATKLIQSEFLAKFEGGKYNSGANVEKIKQALTDIALKGMIKLPGITPGFGGMDAPKVGAAGTGKAPAGDAAAERSLEPTDEPATAALDKDEENLETLPDMPKPASAVSPQEKKLVQKLAGVGIDQQEAKLLANEFMKWAQSKQVAAEGFIRRAKKGLVAENILRKRMKLLREGAGSAKASEEISKFLNNHQFRNKPAAAVIKQLNQALTDVVMKGEVSIPGLTAGTAGAAAKPTVGAAGSAVGKTPAGDAQAEKDKQTDRDDEMFGGVKDTAKDTVADPDARRVSLGTVAGPGAPDKKPAEEKPEEPKAGEEEAGESKPEADPNTIAGQLELAGVEDIKGVITKIDAWAKQNKIEIAPEALKVPEGSEKAAGGEESSTVEEPKMAAESKYYNPRKPSGMIRHPSLLPYRVR